MTQYIIVALIFIISDRRMPCGDTFLKSWMCIESKSNWTWTIMQLSILPETLFNALDHSHILILIYVQYSLLTSRKTAKNTYQLVGIANRYKMKLARVSIQCCTQWCELKLSLHHSIVKGNDPYYATNWQPNTAEHPRSLYGRVM